MKVMLFKGHSTRLELLIEKIQANKENHNSQDIKDAIGTEAGSSWSSEGQTSPSSCTTPNSATDLPDTDLTFTVGVTEGTPYGCQFCEKAFPRLSYLKKHEQTHSEHMPFRCEFCSRLFKHKRSRDRHIKLHTGDKKYRCAHCEAAFSRSDHLKIHMKTHDNQKPYQCTVCNRGYNTAAALTSHIQNHKKTIPHEASSTISAFKCLQCTESFWKPEDLTAHVSSHHDGRSTSSTPVSKSKPHKINCTYCTKDTFTSFNDLLLHVQTMHGSSSNGTDQKTLQSHGYQRSLFFAPLARTPTPGQFQLPCPLCSGSFSSAQTLYLHLSSVHGLKGQELECYCFQCSLTFPSVPLYAEHCILSHGSIHQPTISLSNDQPRPTDLRVPKKHEIEEGPSSNKRQRFSIPSSPLPPSAQLESQYEHSGTLFCNQCNAALSDFESFRNHVKAHIEESVLMTTPPSLRSDQTNICPSCGASFSNHTETFKHFLSHFRSTVTEYACQSCWKLFPRPEEVRKHLFDAHSQRLYKCELCKDVFTSKTSIQEHYTDKHNCEAKVYHCSGCPKTQPMHTEAQFEHHIRTVHLETFPILSSPRPSRIQSPRLLRCIYCPVTFTSDLELQFHLASHTKLFKCFICSEKFHVEFLLDKHMSSAHAPLVVNNGEFDNSDKNKDCPSSNSSNVISTSSNKTSNGNLYVSEMLKKSEASHGFSSATTTMTSASNNNNNNTFGVCDICECGDFVSEAELVAHRKLVHHIKTTSNSRVSLLCAYCKESCKSRSELESHMKNHCQGSIGNGKHKCNICDELFLSAVVLAEHKLTHCKVLYGNHCTNCKSLIMNEDQFYIHLAQHNNPNSQHQLILPVGCVICRQTLSTDMEARLHARFHLQNETLSCSVCQQQTNKNDIKDNICKMCRMSPTTASSRCPHCHLKFETASAMEIHLSNAHRKTYKCSKCQASFETESEVQAHVLSHVTDETKEGRKCRLCMQMFSNSSQLQTHLIEHTFLGFSNFTCYICSAVFTSASGLQTHIVEHGLSARPYDCPQCPEKFFFRSELENHALAHSQLESSFPLEDLKGHFLKQKGSNYSLDRRLYDDQEARLSQTSVQDRRMTLSPCRQSPRDVDGKKKEYINVETERPPEAIKDEDEINVDSNVDDGK